MGPIDIIAVEQEARRLRAEEMRRIEDIFARRMALYLRLFGTTLLHVGHVLSELLRPLFSWVPHDHHRPHHS